MARDLRLDMLELQLVLFPQARWAVFGVDACLYRSEIFLLYALRVRRERRKRHKCQQGGFHVEKRFFPGMAWNSH